MRKPNIYLIGYRCTGKTTIGAALARVLGWRFVDMDDRIVAETGKTIAEMVARHGWPFFRKKENDLLQIVARETHQVIGTGGGVVLSHLNVETMRRSGKTVWLRSRPETIRRYLVQDNRTAAYRPDLTDKGLIEEVAETLKAREPIYRASGDIAIDTDDFDIERLCARILESFGNDEITDCHRR